MALSGSGISFGDFQDIEANEYEKLFGQAKEPLHCNYLELPWDEDGEVQEADTVIQHDEPAVSMEDKEQSLQVQQQQQLLQQQEQQQISLQLQHQQQQNQHIQQQNEQQQNLQMQQQQQMLNQHHQQQQQHLQDQQLCQQQQLFQLQQGHHQQQNLQQQQQQHAFSAVCMNPQPSNTTFQQSSTQSSTQTVVPNQVAPTYTQPMPSSHLQMAPHGHSHLVEMQAQMLAQAQIQMVMHGYMPMNPAQTQGQVTNLAQAPSTDASGGQVMPDEASRSSDGQAAESNETETEAGKKRRNKKRRDPSFYANFYSSDPGQYNPNQYSRIETAYYADNESSGSSSGASSEVFVGGSGGMELGDIQHKMDCMPKEDPNAPQLGNQFIETKVQKEDPSANSKNTDLFTHHAPERTRPPVAKEEHQSVVSNDLSTAQMPNNSSPSQTQYRPIAVSEPSAIQIQTVPSKTKQNVVEYPRTKASAENVNPHGLSFGVDPLLPADLQQQEVQPLSVESSVAKEPEQEESTVRNPDHREDSAVSSAQQPTPEEDKLDVGVAAITPTPAADQNEMPPQPEEGAKTPPAMTQAALPPPPKPSSWASLFKSSGSVAAAPTPAATVPAPAEPAQTEPKVVPQSDTDDKTPVSVDKDPRAKELGGILDHVVLNHRVMNVHPRGLKNVGNWCYVNSILQALLACPPFYNLMKHVPFFPMQRGPSSSPMLDAMVEFVSKFSEQPNRTIQKKGTMDVKAGFPFEPSVVYQMLTVAQTSLSVKQGRQEDAEEFLGCLLNGLHEEMLALMKFYNPGKYEDPNVQGTVKTNGLSVQTNHTKAEEEEEEDEADEWEQVGPRNKSSITRVAHFNRSPLYDIFGGQMRSALHQQGSKESATLQPFFTLQLDIQSDKIWTVREAIENLGNKEALHGFTCNKTKQEVEASRRISLEELPPVLTLHLKRFVYDKSGGCQKVMKKLDYGVELEINRDLLSPNIKSKVYIGQRTYKLFAVVYHTGKEASGGHYITDIFHAGSNSWLRLDDGIVKPVRLVHVIKPLQAYTPYLLFYRRRDLI